MKQARIVKIEKGVFFVEYKTSPWGDWKTIDKKFSTRTKAKLYIIEKGWEEKV